MDHLKSTTQLPRELLTTWLPGLVPLVTIDSAAVSIAYSNWKIEHNTRYLFIMSIVREAQKHSIVQYKSGAKVKQEKAYALFKKKK